ncbi:Os04g0404000, partial [Oryza sativa Japonica Group]
GGRGGAEADGHVTLRGQWRTSRPASARVVRGARTLPASRATRRIQARRRPRRRSNRVIPRHASLWSAPKIRHVRYARSAPFLFLGGDSHAATPGPACGCVVAAITPATSYARHDDGGFNVFA